MIAARAFVQDDCGLEVEKTVQEHPRGKARRPRLPWFEAGHRKRILLERLADDAERIAHVLAAPADDVTGFRGRRETIGRLVPAVGGGVSRRQGVALADMGLQLLLELAKRFAEVGLERADRIPSRAGPRKHLQQFPHRFAGRQNLFPLSNLEDERAHAERQRGAHANAKRRPIG